MERLLCLTAWASFGLEAKQARFTLRLAVDPMAPLYTGYL